jgi:hypothetical protein
MGTAFSNKYHELKEYDTLTVERLNKGARVWNTNTNKYKFKNSVSKAGGERQPPKGRHCSEETCMLLCSKQKRFNPHPEKCFHLIPSCDLENLYIHPRELNCELV